MTIRLPVVKVRPDGSIQVLSIMEQVQAVETEFRELSQITQEPDYAAVLKQLQDFDAKEQASVPTEHYVQGEANSSFRDDETKAEQTVDED